MRKLKGAALPSAIMLCTFLLIVSFGVSSLIIQTSNLNKANDIIKNQRVVFLESCTQYVSTDPRSVSNIKDKTVLSYRVYTEGNYKALCGYVGGDQLRYYAIFDTTQNYKIVAYQTSNLYIDGSNRVGGLVTLGESYE